MSGPRPTVAPPPSWRTCIPAATSFPRINCACTSSSQRRWDDEAGSNMLRCSTSEAKKSKARVKNGILPNKQMGRALRVGKSYTLLVRADWQDANGLPLKESFRRTFRVGPPDTHPLDTAQWRIEPPKAGAQSALVVTFPEPVDHGLLFRALGVRRRGAVIDGESPSALTRHSGRLRRTSRGRRVTTICSRCRSWKIVPAIRPAAPSRWTTSRRSTKVQPHAP